MRHTDTTLEGAWHGQSVKPAAGSQASTPATRTPPPELLTDVEAAALLGMPVRKFHKLRHEDWMPHAVELSPRALRWVRGELLQAVISQAPRRKVQEEPVHFRTARGRQAVHA